MKLLSTTPFPRSNSSHARLGFRGRTSAPRHARRRDLNRQDATVRHELDLDDLDGLEDVSIDRYGPSSSRTIESILVPVAGGPNSDVALRFARNIATSWGASLTLLTVLSTSADDEERRDAEDRLRDYADSVTEVPVETRLETDGDVVSTIAAATEEHELVVIGGSEQSLFQRFFSGSIPERLGRETRAPIFVLSR